MAAVDFKTSYVAFSSSEEISVRAPKTTVQERGGAFGSKPELTVWQRIEKIGSIISPLGIDLDAARCLALLTKADEIMAKPPEGRTVYPLKQTGLARTIEYTGKSVEIPLNGDADIEASGLIGSNSKWLVIDPITCQFRVRTVMTMEDGIRAARAQRTARVFERLGFLKNPSAHAHVVQVERYSFAKHDDLGEVLSFDTPYYCKKDLFEFIIDLTVSKEFEKREFWQLSRAQRLEMILQIAQALQFFKNKKVIHRDLKVENIFLEANGNIRVGDFDSSYLEEESENERGKEVATTAYCTPPERGWSTYPHDIYGFGIIVYMLLTEDVTLLENLAKPRTREQYIETTLGFAKLIDNEKYNHISKAEKDLVKSMLAQNSSKRATIEEVIEKLQEIIAAASSASVSLFERDEKKKAAEKSAPLHALVGGLQNLEV